METIRYSLEVITNGFIAEQVQENFVFPSTPSPDQYKQLTPLFAPYGIAPQDAVKVLMDFEKDPSDLAPQDLKNRINALNVLNNALDNPELVSMIMAAPMAQGQVENINATIMLMKRLIGLLLLEATYAVEGDADADEIAEYFDAPVATVGAIEKGLPQTNAPFTMAPSQTMTPSPTMLSTMAPSPTMGPSMAPKKRSKIFDKIKSLGEKSKSAKQLLTIHNVIIGVLVLIIIYLLMKKK